jgi:hypothetical protein
MTNLRQLILATTILAASTAAMAQTGAGVGNKPAASNAPSNAVIMGNGASTDTRAPVPSANPGAPATASNDPLVQKRITDKAAKAEYKDEKAAAKAKMKEDKKMARAELRDAKKASSAERKGAMSHTAPVGGTAPAATPGSSSTSMGK